MIRTTQHQLTDGETFFYHKLLENGHWRSESEILGDHPTYKAHFLHRWPELYADLLDINHRIALMDTTHLSTLYHDECNHLLQHSPPEAQQLIADELRRMEQIRPPRILSTSMLELQDDQYEAYHRITTAIGHQRNPQAHHFFITGPAGTGKSFLLRALEEWLALQRMSVLKMAPTGIATCAIGGKTIH